MADKIIERAKKLKALAERGIDGEKGSAKVFYEKFLKKHNLSDDDISGKNYNRIFSVKNWDENGTLLKHIIESVNSDVEILGNKKKKQVKVALDDEEYIEVIEKYKFFCQLLTEEKELMFYAFLNKHANHLILAPTKKAPVKNPVNNPPPPEEIAKKPKEKPKEKENEDENGEDENKPPSAREKIFTNADVDRMIKYLQALRTVKWVKARKTLSSKPNKK